MPFPAVGRLALGDRRHEAQVRVPGEEDPRVLADLGHEGVRLGAARRLGVDAGEVRARQHLADDAGGGAGIGEIVDDQDVLTVARDRFQNSRRPLILMVVRGDADGVDHADVELAGDDRRRHHAAASDRHDAAPGAALGQPPGKRAGVAMKLIP